MIEPDVLAGLFRALVGQRIPGGCADCDAHFEVDLLTGDVASVVVVHADACPAHRAQHEEGNW